MKQPDVRVLTRDIDPYHPRKRVAEVDILRGLPIFLVVLYHLCYDICQIPSLVSNWYYVIAEHPNFYQFYLWVRGLMTSSYMSTYLVPLFAGMFLFACGVSCSLSKNNWKRALELIVVSTLLSLATFGLSELLDYNLSIEFGILHIMAFSVTVYALIESVFKLFKKKVPAGLCLFVGVIVYWVGLILREGVNIDGTTIVWPNGYLSGNLLTWIYHGNYEYFPLSALGYYGNYVDWWPIFPWFGLIFIGAAIGIVLYGDKKETRLKFLDWKVFKPLRWIGGHTIWVYIFHQPVIIVGLALVCPALGLTL